MITTQKEIHNLIRILAAKYNLTIKQTQEIVMSQFSYLKKEMSKGEVNNYPTFKNVLLKHLGTFYASEGKINHMLEISKRKEDENNT
jgi:nucleoid DNA-binding protein